MCRADGCGLNFSPGLVTAKSEVQDHVAGSDPVVDRDTGSFTRVDGRSGG
jgi:hypothetical protein